VVIVNSYVLGSGPFDVRAFLADALNELFARRRYSTEVQNRHITNIAESLIAQEYTDSQSIATITIRQLELLGVPGAFQTLIFNASRALIGTSISFTVLSH
jgi:hypothetical protein